jgi:hypothetical protein
MKASKENFLCGNWISLYMKLHGLQTSNGKFKFLVPSIIFTILAVSFCANYWIYELASFLIHGENKSLFSVTRLVGFMNSEKDKVEKISANFSFV